MYKPGRIRSERWRDVALLCRDRARTVPAIAREMKVPAGSIQSLVASMRRENILEEVETDGRGAALRLTRRGRAELRKHKAAGGVDAVFKRGERLVLVIDEGRGMPAEVLAELASDPSFQWAARFDGPVRWIASFGSGDAVAADRAVNALVGAGARAVVGTPDAFFAAAGLAEFAKRLGARPRGDRPGLTASRPRDGRTG